MKKKWRHTEEAKAKMRAARLGTKIDKKTKAKIKATMRRSWDLIRQARAAETETAA